MRVSASKGPSKAVKPIADSDLATGPSELSRHLIRAQEEERKRISRELHDEAGQGLMVLRLYLGMLVEEINVPEHSAKIVEAMAMLDRTIGDLRRIIARLSPRTLEDLGLLTAIRKEARELSRATGMKAHLVLPDPMDGIGDENEIAVYRSVQEALNNIAKHSRARNFTVSLEGKGNYLRLMIEDDGIGFSRNGSASNRTFGIAGMRERIAALGGSMRIRSRKGKGTRIRIILPASPASWVKDHPGEAERRHGARKQPGARKARNQRAAVPFRGMLKDQSYSHGHQVHSS